MSDQPARSGREAASIVLNRRGNWPWWLAPLLVVMTSAGLMHLAERTFRLADGMNLPDGYRLQDWTSNWTMQTLGLEDMLPFGPRALWYDHVYPPLLDGIRYLLMLPETSAGQPPNAINVDFRLYVLYALCFGVTNAVIYVWIRDLTKNGWWSLGATAMWAISPGYITVMQLLEPSPLAVTFISSMFYLLYRFLKTRRFGYVPAFLAMALLASLTRNITQPHVLLVLFAATGAFWFIAAKKSWVPLALSVIILGLLCVLPVKQQVMFGTWDTSTYSGYHRAGMLWIDPRTVPDAQYPQHIVDDALVFSSRFNTQETLKDNYRLTQAANQFLFSQPVDSVKRLARSLTVTFPEMIRPTSMYTENYFVEKIPWRAGYDWVFSSWRYGLLILASLILVIWGRGWRSAVVLLRRYGWFIVMYGLIAAPVLWSNRYFPGREDEGPIWTDAIRLKIFLEIPFWVFFSYSVWLGIDRLRRHRNQRASSATVGS